MGHYFLLENQFTICMDIGIDIEIRNVIGNFGRVLPNNHFSIDRPWN